MTKIVVILKTHGQISKKQCFEKYCSCEKLCQFSLRKKCPYSELFWSVFCHIRTEQGKILRISSHSVRMQKIRDRITPNTDTFHAVFLLYMEYPIGVNWNFLFQILLITRLFPSPSPPFYIWSSLTSHQIQWDIRIPFFIFLLREKQKIFLLLKDQRNATWKKSSMWYTHVRNAKNSQILLPLVYSSFCFSQEFRD